MSLTQLVNHDWADVFVVIELLTFQAIDTLIGIDVATLIDRLDHALLRANLTRVAAIWVALQPVKHAQPPRDRKRGSKQT